MSKKDTRGLIIVSIVAVLLMIGLLYKSYQVFWGGNAQQQVPAVDTSLLTTYQNEIESGPSLVEIDGNTVDDKSEEKEEPVKKEVEKKTAPEKKKEEPKPASSEKFIVITGSFGSKTNAENWKKELEGKSYDAKIHYQKTRGLYYVYVKSFDKMNLAENYAVALRQKGIECHIKKI